MVSYSACASEQCVDIVMYTIHYTKIYIVDQEDELYLNCFTGRIPDRYSHQCPLKA